ncbi:MAG: hypothetical protein J4G03_07325 [Gemmatimonadetes bacterium]|nr:hypothetical protein [Gemmatimonadota bacterium]
MTNPKHLKPSVVALVALAVGGGCGDPVDPVGGVVPAGAVVAENARDNDWPIGQREVLDSVYSKTGGKRWNDNTNWLTDEPLDEWYGVSADAKGNVLGLNLGDNGLTGSIPAELGDLRSLTELHLSDNDLTGPIPAELGDLDSLTDLHLSDNDLTGPIPAELGDLDSLTDLHLSDNYLTGPIPAYLGDLESLTDLRLHGNSGLRGPLPNALAGVPLNTFLWYDTGLCAPTDARFQAWLDSISDEQGALDCGDRWVLHLFYGDTDGENWDNNTNWLTDEPLGDWYGVSADAQGNVTRLSLVNNNLTGSIPAELGDLESLTELHLPSNDLTGSIPAELGNLESLIGLLLQGNSGLRGPLPDYIHLSDNDLTGSIPAELGDLESLTKLNLSYNSLTGSIPAELGNLASLTRLSLYNNDLTGSIPAELGNLESLTALSLFSNGLTGSIPAELGNLESLTRLSLSDNYLTGPIPAELGNLENLTALSLFNNGLTGSIPAELGDLESLTALSLYNNDLTGPVPAELGNLESLIGLLLQGNSGLRGPLPGHHSTSFTGTSPVFARPPTRLSRSGWIRYRPKSGDRTAGTVRCWRYSTGLRTGRSGTTTPTG